MKQLKKGESGYPVDNSYSSPIGRHNNLRLAGIHGKSPLEVKAISDPFKNKEGDLEFIMVEYDNNYYMILNIFHESKESMNKRVEEIKEIYNQDFYYYN